MKWYPYLLISLAGSLLVAAVAGSRVRTGPPYTVAALQAGLATDAPAWDGRSV